MAEKPETRLGAGKIVLLSIGAVSGILIMNAVIHIVRQGQK